MRQHQTDIKPLKLQKNGLVPEQYVYHVKNAAFPDVTCDVTGLSLDATFADLEGKLVDMHTRFYTNDHCMKFKRKVVTVGDTLGACHLLHGATIAIEYKPRGKGGTCKGGKGKGGKDAGDVD